MPETEAQLLGCRGQDPLAGEEHAGHFAQRHLQDEGRGVKDGGPPQHTSQRGVNSRLVTGTGAAALNAPMARSTPASQMIMATQSST